jgi:hypothetical protein
VKYEYEIRIERIDKDAGRSNYENRTCVSATRFICGASLDIIGLSTWIANQTVLKEEK